MRRVTSWVVAIALSAGWTGMARSEPAPRIEPDYAGITIPPNIAPMNFVVRESGSVFRVVFTGAHGGAFAVQTTSGRVGIPAREWRALLMANTGAEARVSIARPTAGGGWRAFAVITNRVATAPIDPWLGYRSMKSVYNLWRDIVLVQRNLTSFECRPIIRGNAVTRSASGICVNCHTFRNRDPEWMVFGTRYDDSLGSSAILAVTGSVSRINTRFGYSAWHPNGTLIAYATMRVKFFEHRAGMEPRDVVDLDSDLAFCRMDGRTLDTVPQIANPDYQETYPEWSPDGRHLYFCRSRIIWEDRKTVPPANYAKSQYDLARIAYDPDKNQWGAVETLLPAAVSGKSALEPRISPDGRFLVFCLCDYGCFPVFRPDSDLHISDLSRNAKSGRFEYRKLECNSDTSESWHAWSGNGRWLVFSSKRLDGVFARPHFAYIDEDGHASKPFVLPQEDPEAYDVSLNSLTVPEFMTGPVSADERELVRAARNPAAGSKVNQPSTWATRTNATPLPRETPYGQRE